MCSEVSVNRIQTTFSIGFCQTFRPNIRLIRRSKQRLNILTKKLMSVLKGFDPEFEYAEECHQYLMIREKQRLQFHNRSPQLEYREELIKRIQVLCHLFKLSVRVKQLSIYVMDFFMDNHDIVEDRIELMVASCLIIAAKVEESDNKIPKFTELVLDLNQYLKSEAMEMETKILEFFDWVFLTPTAATFVDYFYAKCLPQTAINRNSQALVDKYLDKSNETRFYKFYPSVIAAAVLFCVRLSLNLTPLWPPIAQSVTTYSFIQIENCVHELKKTDLLVASLKRFNPPNGHQSVVDVFNDSGIFECDSNQIK